MRLRLSPTAPEELREEPAPPGPRTKKQGRKGRIPAVWRPRLLEECDGRWSIVKELKERQERLKRETNADSYAKQVLCERASFLIALIETTEVRALEGEALDLGAHHQAVNALLGLLETLGLNKATKDATLEEYIAGKHPKPSDDAEDDE